MVMTATPKMVMKGRLRRNERKGEARRSEKRVRGQMRTFKRSKSPRSRVPSLDAPDPGVAEPLAGVKRRSSGSVEHEAGRRRLTRGRRARLDGNEVCGMGPARPVRTARNPAGRAGGRRAPGQRDRELPRRGAAIEPQPARPGCGPKRVDRLGQRRSGRPAVPPVVRCVDRVRPAPGRAGDGLGPAGEPRAASRAPCQAAAQAEWRSSDARCRWPWPAAPHRSPPRIAPPRYRERRQQHVRGLAPAWQHARRGLTSRAPSSIRTSRSRANPQRTSGPSQPGQHSAGLRPDRSPPPRDPPSSPTRKHAASHTPAASTGTPPQEGATRVETTTRPRRAR